MKILLSILSALLLVLSFAPFGLGWLSWFCFVPFFFIFENSSKKEVFKHGYIFGVVFFLGTIYWVVNSLYLYGEVSFILSVFLMLLLVLYLALFFALFALGFSYTSGYKDYLRLLFLPALWVSLEFLRSIIFTGFPWVLLGYSQIEYSYVIQIADIAGVWGLSFFVMTLNVVIYLNISGFIRRRKIAKKETALTVVLIVLVLGYGIFRLSAISQVPFASEGVSEVKSLSVALVQGNVEQSEKWEPLKKEQAVREYRTLSLTPDKSKTRPELIVWPETAMPFFFSYEEFLSRVVKNVAVEAESFLLTGAPYFEFGEDGKEMNFYNSAFLIDKSGSIASRYDKVHLVPFGEYVPFRKVLFFVEKLTEGLGDFKPGPGAIPLELEGSGGEALGVLICFEAIFPELSARLVKNGATMLVNITNDGWFGHTSAPFQHLEMSRLRAVENRVYLVRAANTGISAIIDPLGRVQSKSDIFTDAVVRGEVNFKSDGLTVFSRFPWFMPAFCIVLSILILFVIKRRERNV
ncbi:MAG: apolipoprotein N-acyltransferase [Deltaproteobacteria bacterium]|nr:apolipoprotein N-acyltransferase [Deltaproteobacteria bacterium]